MRVDKFRTVILVIMLIAALAGCLCGRANDYPVAEVLDPAME